MFLPGAEQVGLALWRRWVLSGRRGEAVADPPGSGWTLPFTGRYRITFLLTTGLFAGVLIGAFAAGSFEGRPAWQPWVLGGVCAGIAALQAYLLLASFLDRVTVTEQGVALRRLFRADLEFPWADVVRISPNDEGDGWIFLRRDGTKGEVSRFLDGLLLLRRMLEARVPAPVWEEASPHLP
jgi:hypothetical protein